MMFKQIHLLIVVVYFLCPVVVLTRAVWLQAKRRRFKPMRRFRLTLFLGLCVGIGTCVIYAIAMQGRVMFTQVVLAAYLATSLMLLLQGLDYILWHASRILLRLSKPHGSVWWYNTRATAGLLVRAAIVFCIGLPYVLVAVTTFRPRVAIAATPLTLEHWLYQRIEFSSADGTRIVGWWIPAIGGESSHTVVFCPGAGADKPSQLSMVRQLIGDQSAGLHQLPVRGYNILVLDFRAHGESAGQLCSFGDLERNDVLGAMRWLRQTHEAACRKVVGLGVSTGGAALLAAAADPSVEGQNIDAIAVYDTFDRLDNASRAVAEVVPQPLRWWVNRIGLTMASCQVGSDLSAFAPSTSVKAIWPRPVLVIHGIDDQYIPFKAGQALFESAMEPKEHDWLKRSNHEQALSSKSAAELVRRYFDAAQRLI